MNRQGPDPSFALAARADRISDFATEGEIARRAAAYEQNRRSYFQSENWRLAAYALDLLLESTKGKFRDDGFTPEWIHSARPTELLDSLTKSGFMNRTEIERKYGSYEILICDWLLHDLGENENITPDFLRNYFITRIIEDIHLHYTDAQRNRDLDKIEPIVRDFELLTHGKNGEKAFNAYLIDIMESGYAFLAKLGDRCDNLATLINLNRPNWTIIEDTPEDKAAILKYFEKIRRYYSHTGFTFSTHDLVGQACELHPSFARAYDAMDAIMGFEFDINRAYIGYHPHHPNNAQGKSKRLDPSLLILDVSRNFEKARLATAHMHHGANPMEIITGRLAAEIQILPELNFKFQTQPRDRRLRPPTAIDHILNTFRLNGPGA